MNSKPIISVIIPVYNAGGYVGASIESVIAQSIGFEKNVEIIVVDDGSTDNSSDICNLYVTQYTNNIRYIKQKNKGVSATRNRGLLYAQGKYVHFLDSDDILSRNFYKKSVQFLEKNEGVDFVASKLKFFDASIDSHPLNNKFRKTGIIDVDTTPDNPLLHVISCVFKREAIEETLFDTRLKIAEDAKFLSEIIRKKNAYGVLDNTTYFYRKRRDESSAIGGKLKNKDYYLATPKFAYLDMVHMWSFDGALHSFMQHTLLYDLSYRLNQHEQFVLSDKEEKTYKKLIKDVVRRIDDDTIRKSSYLDIHTKKYLLNMRGVSSRFNEDPSFVIDFITRQNNDSYKIEGYFDGISETDDVYISVDGTHVKPQKVERKQREISFLGDLIYDGGAVEISIPIKIKQKSVMTATVVDDNSTVKVKTNQFTRLNNLVGSYRRDKDTLVSKGYNSVTFASYSLARHVGKELLCVLGIVGDWKIGEVVRRVKLLRKRNLSQLSLRARVVELIKPFLFTIESVVLIPRALTFRLLYYVAKKHRAVWIISDRGMSAGDNGEALFRYIMSQADQPAEVYFAISKKSEDFNRLSEIGPVLNYGSLLYKFKFLMADKIISSHADIEVINPFLRQIDHFVNLYTFDFIFLQHGIIRNDLSGWLNRFERNIKIFITSAQKEYNSILKYPYYYSEDNLLLSGLPRYDYLENNQKNKLIVAPTYRMSLLRLKTDKYGVRDYDDQFRYSEYCKFYNKLINDNRLLEAMRRSGMTGEFYVHPNFAAQTGDFLGNELFQIKTYPYDYKKAISEGSLLVTDFSSLVFDFAYLRKPVVYAQFDADTFFDGHSYDKGDFFSDERDGFGPITNTHDMTIDNIVKYVNCNDTIEAKYLKRIDTFFTYEDKNNSRRVYDVLAND